jgi:hypothetical protein
MYRLAHVEAREAKKVAQEALCGTPLASVREGRSPNLAMMWLIFLE